MRGQLLEAAADTLAKEYPSTQLKTCLVYAEDDQTLRSKDIMPAVAASVAKSKQATSSSTCPTAGMGLGMPLITHLPL